MSRELDLHFRIDKDFELSKALSLEWLETNGLGGYASSTITNAHTRRYHGLLTASLSDPFAAGKYVLLSKLEDSLTYQDKIFYLSSSQYPAHFERGGFEFLKECVCDLHPCFIYQIDQWIVMKEIQLLYLENTVLIKYKILGGNPPSDLKFNIRPLLAYRDFHQLTHENLCVQMDTVACCQGRAITPYAQMPTLFMQASDIADFIPTPVWYRNFEYSEEQKRGFDYHEDLFSPGVFTVEGKKEIIFAFSLCEITQDLSSLWKKELTRREKLLSSIKGDAFQKQLYKAGQAFIERDPKNKSAVACTAGFPWFGSWGRDTMISLPGLLLSGGEAEKQDFLNILKRYANEEREGLLPNILGETPDKHAYNTVDASLWFIWAIQQYYLHSREAKNIHTHFWKVMKNIFSYYQHGTLYSIKMMDNGILYAGDAHTNVTWMDAVLEGNPATSRYGAQVEINALWYNALCFMEELAKKFKDSFAKELKPIIKSLQTAFPETFWNSELDCLYDFVNEYERNDAIRPNQIFAVSLPYSPLSKAMAEKVMRNVQEHLLTPYGLRTLSPSDPDYRGIYAGNSAERDSAYHNGTVWPWLLGHFFDALGKLTSSKELKKNIDPCLDALAAHLREAGIGGISEVFSGESPHQPNGCISQAWSVAEILRIVQHL